MNKSKSKSKSNNVGRSFVFFTGLGILAGSMLGNLPLWITAGASCGIMFGTILALLFDH